MFLFSVLVLMVDGEAVASGVALFYSLIHPSSIQPSVTIF